MSDVTATMSTGSGLTASMKVGTGLTANLKEPDGDLTSYCAQYQTYYDSLTTPPAAAVALAQDTMFVSLVAEGLWTKADLIYLLSQSTNDDGEALVNAVSPGTYDGTAYNAPTFESLAGFTGDGATTYIDTNFNPTTHGVNYTLNSASFAVYVLTDVDENSVDIGIDDGNNDAFLYSRYITCNTRINDSGSDFNTNADSRGFYIVSRTASNARAAYKNGALLGSDTRVSTALPNVNFGVMARINFLGGQGQYVTRQIGGIVYIGGGLDATEQLALTTAVNTYMTSNSKNTF